MTPLKPIHRPLFSASAPATVGANLTPGELPRLSIRVATLADFEVLTALATETAAVVLEDDYSPRQIATLLRYGLGADVQLVRDRTCYMVEHAGRVIASGAWSYRAALMGHIRPQEAGSERDMLDPAAGDAARLRALFVHPAFVRRGIGRMLVALCERLASAAGFGGLEALATPPARRLLAAGGFADVERTTHIFPDGTVTGTYLMRKAIEAAIAVAPDLARSN
jgi:GNAT superfamily N-acetyltransferase